MSYARRREHWVFTDSRGSGLYEKIKQQHHPEFIGVWKKSGATFQEIVDLAANHLQNYPFDVVYVVGGANNITTKNNETGQISFDWNPPELLIQYLLSELNRADGRLLREFPASKAVFCPLVGTDLNRVVTAHKVTDHQQHVVNEAIFDFNNETFKINKRRETFAPSLHRTIHRSKKGTKKSYYEHLVDGIHLQEHIKDKWAIEFVKAAGFN